LAGFLVRKGKGKGGKGKKRKGRGDEPREEGKG